MTQQVKVGGAWKTAVPRVKVGGAWKTVKGGYVKVAGVWRKFHDQYLDTQVVVPGVNGVAPNRAFGFWSGTGPFGSMSDGTCDFLGGAPFAGMYWNEAGPQLMFAMTGTLPNSGWTSMTLLGLYSVTRASAGFVQSGGNTYWSWNGVANPYAANRIVIWT